MKMMRSTSITSTKGVTLMSLFWPRSKRPPPPPPSFAPMRKFLPWGVFRPALKSPAPIGKPPRRCKARSRDLVEAMQYAFDAYVTAVSFDTAGKAVFALGDGSVRFEDGAAVDAHDGAILAAVAHPSGQGLLTGGDDGGLVWAQGWGAREIAALPGKWIDAVAASPASGLIAFSAGREAHVRD